MITHKPNDTDSYYNRGIAYYEKREYDKAIANFSEVIKREPNHAEAYYKRGSAYDDKVDFDQAIADFSMAIKLEPEYADAYGYHADLTIIIPFLIEYFSICM